MAKLPEYELMARMSEELEALRQQNAQLLEAFQQIDRLGGGHLFDVASTRFLLEIIMHVREIARAAIAAAEGGR